MTEKDAELAKGVGQASDAQAFAQVCLGLCLILGLLGGAVSFTTGNQEAAMMFTGLAGMFGFGALNLALLDIAWKKVVNHA